MELPKDYAVSEKSRSTYINLLKRIRSLVPEPIDFKDEAKVIKLLEASSLKPSVRGSMFQFLKGWPGVEGSLYARQQRQAQDLHIALGTSKQSLPTRREILSRRDSLDKNSVNYLYACMYTLMPALRPSVWAGLEVTSKSKSNHLDPDTGLLYIYDQKKPSVPPMALRIPVSLKDLILKHGGVQATRTNIYQSLKRWLGVTPTQMRKIWATYAATLDPPLYLKVCKVMGHSITTSKAYYKRG
jgi:hypothetical protein